MSAFGDFTEQDLLNHYLRGTQSTSPATVYLALFTTDPTDDGSGSEMADSGYAREAITFGAPSVSGAGYSCANSGTIEFGAVADGQVTVSHFAIFDASTAGNLLFHGAFNSFRTLEVDDVPTVAAGAVNISAE